MLSSVVYNLYFMASFALLENFIRAPISPALGFITKTVEVCTTPSVLEAVDVDEFVGGWGISGVSSLASSSVSSM